MISNKDVVLELTKIHHPNSGLKIIGKCESDLSGVTIMDGSSLSFTFLSKICAAGQYLSAGMLKPTQGIFEGLERKFGAVFSTFIRIV